MEKSVREEIKRKVKQDFYSVSQVSKILKNLGVTYKAGRAIFTKADVKEFVQGIYLFETTENLLGPKYERDKNIWVKREWLYSNFSSIGLYFTESRIEKAVEEAGFN